MNRRFGGGVTRHRSLPAAIGGVVALVLVVGAVGAIPGPRGAPAPDDQTDAAGATRGEPASRGDATSRAGTGTGTGTGIGAAAAGHRWFIVPRAPGRADRRRPPSAPDPADGPAASEQDVVVAPDGWAVAHAGPGLDPLTFRGHAGVGNAPEFLATDGPDAWMIFAPPGPGVDRSVRSVSLRWNPSVGVWYAAATPVLQIEPRWPADWEPIDLAIDARGPVVLARRGEAIELVRPGPSAWTARPFEPPVRVDSDGRVPRLVAVTIDAGPSNAAGDASPASTSTSTSTSADADPAADRATATDAEAPATAPASAHTNRVILVRPATASERAGDGATARMEALDTRGRRGETRPANLPDAFFSPDASERQTRRFVAVDGGPWIVQREDEAFIARAIAGRTVGGPARGTGAILPGAVVEGPLSAAGLVVGGPTLARVDGPRADQLEIRRWTAGGEALGPPEPFGLHRIDPMSILGGPMILGAGIFIAVIAGVLGSRPQPPPPALEGRLAPGGIRTVAAAIDLAPAFIVASLFFGTGPGGILVSLIMFDPSPIPWLGMCVLYLFSVAGGEIGRGRSLGRRVLRLHVVDADGRVPRRGILVRRWLLRSAAIAFPPLAAFWAAHAMCRGLHDLTCGTWVIRTERRLELGPGGGPRPGDDVPRDPADG